MAVPGDDDATAPSRRPTDPDLRGDDESRQEREQRSARADSPRDAQTGDRDCEAAHGEGQPAEQTPDIDSAGTHEPSGLVSDTQFEPLDSPIALKRCSAAIAVEGRAVDIPTVGFALPGGAESWRWPPRCVLLASEHDSSTMK
jgi:hypothetical protein